MSCPDWLGKRLRVCRSRCVFVVTPAYWRYIFASDLFIQGEPTLAHKLMIYTACRSGMNFEEKFSKLNIK